MVTILVCALTVTKYDCIKRKLLVRSTRNKVDIWCELILALIIATLLKKMLKKREIYDLYAYCTKNVIAALNIHLVSIAL